MDNDNPWCSVTDDFYGKLGDIQIKYGDDDVWSESDDREYAELEARLKDHIEKCPQCCIADLRLHKKPATAWKN